MLTLNVSSIYLKQSAADKLQAIELIGQKMVSSGYATDDYAAGLKAREAISSTYLGNGIAIPHGTPDSRESVTQTGVVVIQFPEGVDWGEDEKVYLAVGIAARSNEHLDILSGLTKVLDRDELCRELALTDNPEMISDAINGRSKAEPLLCEGLIQSQLAVHTPLGLKAVAASLLGSQGYLKTDEEEKLAQSKVTLMGKIAMISTSQCESSGISMLVPQEPVAFGENQVSLLVAIAANSQEHLPAMRQIALWADDAELTEKLSTIKPSELMKAAKGEGWPVSDTGSLSREFTIYNQNGMHARPGKVFVSTIKPFEARVEVCNRAKNDTFINGKSLMKLLSLGITKGSIIEVRASGADAPAAMNALEKAITERLGE